VGLVGGRARLQSAVRLFSRLLHGSKDADGSFKYCLMYIYVFSRGAHSFSEPNMRSVSTCMSPASAIHMVSSGIWLVVEHDPCGPRCLSLCAKPELGVSSGSDHCPMLNHASIQIRTASGNNKPLSGSALNERGVCSLLSVRTAPEHVVIDGIPVAAQKQKLKTECADLFDHVCSQRHAVSHVDRVQEPLLGSSGAVGSGYIREEAKRFLLDRSFNHPTYFSNAFACAPLCCVCVCVCVSVLLRSAS